MADLQSSGGQTNGVSSENFAPSLGSKRQRRPSVRLGEIGDQSASFAYESYVRRSKQWKISDESKFRSSLKCLLPGQRELANKMSKTRPLMNLGNGDSHENQEKGTSAGEEKKPYQNFVSSEGNLDLMESSSGRNVILKEGIGNRRGKEARTKRGAKRFASSARSNWVSKVGDEVEEEEKMSGDDGLGEPMSNAAFEVETHDGYRDFDLEGSDTPREMKEQLSLQNDSPEHAIFDPRTSDSHHGVGKIHGEDREVGFLCQRNHGKVVRTRVSESRDPAPGLDYNDAIELDAPSDTEARDKREGNDFLSRDWKYGTNLENNAFGERRCRSLDDGVRMWLTGLGLSRYASVFEIHEVDEEVLPLLTLEDLKDMGINAVGSRRKMYCAIQKLGKSFT